MKKMLKKLKKLSPIYDRIAKELLIPMKYEYKDKQIIVDIETKEFTCICPWSKLPDFATLRIKYIPDKYCIELKSLKYYLQSYRNVGIVHESAVNRIFEDLYNTIFPKWLYVELEFEVRGGIKTKVIREEKR